MRRVLMIAFHFPPLAGSSGIQRTLRFAQQLPDHGWEPIVLTASPRAYERTSDDLLRELPAGLSVHRAFALNTATHLAVRGRYPALLARPDRWITWALAAIPAGVRLVRRYRPAALWSTYPIATAHVIGRWIARLTGLPWIADFRDPMAQDGYPPDPATWRAFANIERGAVTGAAASVFVTRGAAAMYRARYPGAAERIAVIENGFDEPSFAGLPPAAGPLVPGRRTLLHSGIVYPWERDPTQLFAALAALKRAGRAGDLLVRFRASAQDEFLRELARKHDVADLIELAPPLPYRDALEEMQRADGLLVLQASNCNEQIPAKVYEYLRAGQPILALTDPNGDTAELLRRCGVRYLAPLDDAAAIEAIVPRFMAELDAARPNASAVAACSRESRTRELAALLDRVAGA
ncbi:MAG TPA: glycosyltransferase [Burkholderiaceae bacterium]|nr:glycosyltransferase [Burkholderiaceae bacterium]